MTLVAVYGIVSRDRAITEKKLPVKWRPRITFFGLKPASNNCCCLAVTSP